MVGSLLSRFSFYHDEWHALGLCGRAVCRAIQALLEHTLYDFSFRLVSRLHL